MLPVSAETGSEPVRYEQWRLQPECDLLCQCNEHGGLRLQRRLRRQRDDLHSGADGPLRHGGVRFPCVLLRQQRNGGVYLQQRVYRGWHDLHPEQRGQSVQPGSLRSERHLCRCSGRGRRLHLQVRLQRRRFRVRLRVRESVLAQSLRLELDVQQQQRHRRLRVRFGLHE